MGNKPLIIFGFVIKIYKWSLEINLYWQFKFEKCFEYGYKELDIGFLNTIYRNS